MNGKRKRMPTVAVSPRYRDLPVGLTSAGAARDLFAPLTVF